MPSSLRRKAAYQTLLLWIASVLLFSAGQPATVFAETDVIDLKALARKARPAVMLLVVKDAKGDEIATGTGFLVSSDGKLFTNFHVIKNASSAAAKAENGGSFPVEGVLASDPKNDLVLLQIKGKDLPFLTLAAGDKIEAGTRVAVIGSPLGLEGTISEGIVSAVRELMGERRMLQITAAISPGSSGSPVLNANCEVLGVATLIMRGGQGLNFAVPCEVARSLQAKAKESSTPQPLSTVIVREEDKIFSDPDYQAAMAASAAQDYVEMLKRSQALVRRYPESSFAHFCLGGAYYILKFTNDALLAFQQAIKLKPDSAGAWLLLGSVYSKAGRTADAIAAYQQAIKLKPDSDGGWLFLGIEYGKTRREDDAIVALQQAVKVKPNDAEAWSWLALTYGCAGRKDDSIEACRRATKLKPDYAETWSRLGVTYAVADCPTDAIAAYQQATKLKPDYAEAWYLLGEAYCRVGRGEDAITALERAIKLKQDDHRAWNDLGSAYANSGRQTDAIAAFQQAVKLKPDDAVAWLGLGLVYSKAGRADDAIAAYQQATKLKPDYAVAWAGLGAACGKAGRWGDAIAALERAIKLKPDDYEPWYNLGLAYAMNRQMDKARDAQRQLEKLDPAKAQELRTFLQRFKR